MNERDDVRIESDDPEAEVKAADKVQKLKEEIEQLRGEKQEYLDGWQRSKADYVNALKRFEAELRSARQSGVAKAAEALLPVFDALDRAKAHGDLPDGFQAILRQLESAIKSLGLEPVGAVGEVFNPSLHEAFGQDPAPSKEADDTVTAVLEKGWRLGELIVRPAKVRVAHFVA